jgi:hypothetical protein
VNWKDKAGGQSIDTDISEVVQQPGLTGEMMVGVVVVKVIVEGKEVNS